MTPSATGPALGGDGRHHHRLPPAELDDLAAGLMSSADIGVPASWTIRDVDPAIMDAEMTTLADPLQGLVTCPDGALRPAAGWLQRTFSGAEPLDDGMLRVDLVLAVEDAATYAARRGRARQVHVRPGVVPRDDDGLARPPRRIAAGTRRPGDRGHDAHGVGRSRPPMCPTRAATPSSPRTSTGARSRQWSAASTSVYRSTTRHGSWWAACSPGCEHRESSSASSLSRPIRRTVIAVCVRGRRDRRLARRRPSTRQRLHDPHRPRPWRRDAVDQPHR